VRKKAKLDKSAPVSERVKAIIAEQLVPKNELKQSDRIVEDLGGDSLDCVELIMAFEEEFDLEIPDKEAVKLKTVGDCITYLEKAAVKQPAK
jgi:acyl carrier protein